MLVVPACNARSPLLCSHSGRATSQDILPQRLEPWRINASRLTIVPLTATSINGEVQAFDPRLLELFAHGRLTAVWRHYRPFIDEQRERHQDPLLYHQLQQVAERWSAGTRRPSEHAADEQMTPTLPEAGGEPAVSAGQIDRIPHERHDVTILALIWTAT